MKQRKEQEKNGFICKADMTKMFQDYPFLNTLTQKGDGKENKSPLNIRNWQLFCTFALDLKQDK